MVLQGVGKKLLTSKTGLRMNWVQATENKGFPASWFSPRPPHQAEHAAGSCLQEPPTGALIIVSAASGGWDVKSRDL